MSTGKKWEGNEVKAFSDLKVEMPSHVWDYLMGWCKAASSEVSGMMLVEWDPKDAVLRVPNIYLPKQECDSSSTEIDDDALAALQMRLHKEKVNLKSLRGWWHTHYNFATFWSGTDTDTITKLMAGNDWFLSIVVNQDEDFKARLDIAAPFPLVIDDLDIVVTGATEDLSKYKKDIDSQVTKKQVAVLQTYGYGGYGGHLGYGDVPSWKDVRDVERGNWWDRDRMKPVNTAKPTQYDGKWWLKYDPELWHGFKGSAAVDKTAGDAKLRSKAPGQSEEDFQRELAVEAADAAQEEAFLRECAGMDMDPMTIRLDGTGE